MTTGEWDVAALGFDSARAAIVDLTVPYAQLGSSYVVPAASPIKAMSDVDKHGHQIAVTQGSVQELFIKQILKQAQVVSVPDQSAALELLSSGKAHALIANRVQLLDGGKKA